MDELLREEKRRHSRTMRRREERDDRGNLWARGSEMKRKKEGGGCGGTRCSPHSRIGQSLGLLSAHTEYKDGQVKSVAHTLLKKSSFSLGPISDSETRMISKTNTLMQQKKATL